MSNKALTQALEALVQAVHREDDDAAEAVVQRLAGMGAQAVPALLDLSHADNPDLRWWALRVLAEIPDPRVPSRLREALRDPDPAVRQCAALGLRLQPTPDAVDDLIALLADEDRLLASLAAEALMAVGRAATPALIRVIQEGPMPARAQAVRALAQLRDPRTIPVLFSLLDDPSPLISEWAEEGLARLGIGTVFFWP